MVKDQTGKYDVEDPIPGVQQYYLNGCHMLVFHLLYGMKQHSDLDIT
jgi:hypothetical protein